MNVIENKDNFDDEKLVPLPIWLEDTGFSRSNFSIIRPNLKEGYDYVINKDRSIFVNFKNIEKTILEKDWESLLS